MQKRLRQTPIDRQVRSALLHLYDLPYLSAHPLAEQGGPALRAELLEEIEALRPVHPSLPSTEQRHRLITLRYLEGLPIAEVCAAIGVAPSQYHRLHTRALAAISERLAAARASSNETLKASALSGSIGTAWVGRTAELVALRGEHDAAARGEGSRFVLLRGEPGVGKTRLATEFGTRARTAGSTFLVGRYVREGGTGFEPWIDVLRAGLDAYRPAERHRIAAPFAAELAWLAPDLVVQGPPLPNLPPEHQRRRLFDAIAGTLLRLAERAPLVVLLDDLQWAPGLALVAHVVRRIAEGALLVLATARERELREDPTLERDWADLARAHNVRALPIGPLSADETAEIVRRHPVARSGSSARLAMLVHQRTGGNPLFVDQLLRELSERRSAAPDEVALDGDASSLPMPETLRLLVEERVDRLGPGTRELLGQAAVLGAEFGLPPLIAATGLAEDEVTAVIDLAEAAGLLRDRSRPGEERFAFAEDSLQDVLYEGLTPLRRRRLHRRAGDALERLSAAWPEQPADELARHFEGAGDLARAAPFAFRAGQIAAAHFDWPRAIAHYRQALRCWEESGADPGKRADAHTQIGELCYGSGIDGSEAGEHFRAALAIYREIGDTSAQAAAHARLGRHHNAGDPGSRNLVLALHHLDESLRLRAGQPEDGSSVWLYSPLCIGSFVTLRIPEAIEHGQRLTAVAERWGPARSRSAAVWLATSLALAGRVSEALAEYEACRTRAAALAREEALDEGMLRMELAHGALLLELPRLGLAWATGPAPSGPMSHWGQVRLPGLLAGLYALSGDLAEGSRLIAGLREQAADDRSPFYGTEAAVGTLLMRRGDWDEAERLMRDGLAWSNRSHYLLGATLIEQQLAELYVEQRRYEEAEALLEAARARAAAGGARLLVVSSAIALYSLAVETERLDLAAERRREVGEAMAGSDDWGGFSPQLVAVDARCLAAEGRLEDAEAAFASAIASFELLGLAWEKASCLGHWAAAVAPHEPARAAGLADQAAALRSAMGADRYATQALTLLDRAGRFDIIAERDDALAERDDRIWSGR